MLDENAQPREYRAPDMPISYRADHVGSLLRPKALLDARSDPGVSREELTGLEDAHILEALRRQKAAGLRIFTDGEFRRAGFMSDFYDSVEGLDRTGEIARAWKGAASAIGGTSGGRAARSGLAGVAVEKIVQTKRLTDHEVAFLKRHAPGDLKVTLPTANQFPAICYKKGLSERAYPNHSAFLWDIVPIIRAEIEALVADGVKYIQIDAPRYSYYIDPNWRQHIQEEMGVDPEEALDEAVRADNACLDGLAGAKPPGVTFAIHLCRGNNRSQWYASGGYDPIAEKLFNELHVDLFLLEYDSERAGTFEALRFVPKDKAVVLGLVSSKLPELESQEQLARRIEEASRYVPLENLAVSPQCGFASAMEGNLLTEDDQWRKLRLVVDTARKIWKDA
jgi:5-methyltetrahydropteroyltriglutamate--homocysteine methyltransferase